MREDGYARGMSVGRGSLILESPCYEGKTRSEERTGMRKLSRGF